MVEAEPEASEAPAVALAAAVEDRAACLSVAAGETVRPVVRPSDRVKQSRAAALRATRILTTWLAVEVGN